MTYFPSQNPKDSRKSKLKLIIGLEIAAIIAVLAIVALFLLGRTDAGSENTAAEGASTQQSKEPDSKSPFGWFGGGDKSGGASANAPYVEAYKQVLANPANYPLKSASDTIPNGQYWYAMTEATGDSTPELLLKVGGSEIAPVIVFTTDSSGKLIQITDTAADGIATAGGSRVRLEGSKSGTGIYQVNGMAMSPVAENVQFLIQGTSLVKGKVNDIAPAGDDPDHAQLTWLDPSDLSGLEGYVPGAAGNGSNGAVPAPTTADKKAPESGQTADGKLRLTGTVQKWHTSQAMKGRAAPNGEPESNEYIMLVLDEPQTMTAQKANSTDTKTVTEVVLAKREDTSYGESVSDNFNEVASYEGQHVTVTVSQDNMSYPSDTSVPLGGLMIGNYDSIEPN